MLLYTNQPITKKVPKECEIGSVSHPFFMNYARVQFHCLKYIDIEILVLESDRLKSTSVVILILGVKLV